MYILAEDVTAEEVLRERERLLQEFSLRVIHVFESSEKSGGKKDVLGCEDADGRRVILRMGERRPDCFFPEGFVGQTLHIPRQFHSGGTRIPFEIEEWIEGKKIWELEREWSRRGQISPTMRDKLIAVFWEFQRIGVQLPLEQLFTIEKIQFFAREAGELLPTRAHELIKAHKAFWSGSYPAKWKFATDNLILEANGRIALIDNVKVGARYFGYDLGFLIWPRWFEMGSVEGEAFEAHVRYLDEFQRVWIAVAPLDVRRPDNLEEAFTLMLFERLVGSLYDVQR